MNPDSMIILKFRYCFSRYIFFIKDNTIFRAGNFAYIFNSLPNNIYIVVNFICSKINIHSGPSHEFFILPTPP